MNIPSIRMLATLLPVLMPWQQAWAWDVYSAPMAVPYGGYPMPSNVPAYPPQWGVNPWANPAWGWRSPPAWNGVAPWQPAPSWSPPVPEWQVYGEMDAAGHYVMYIRYRGTVYSFVNQ